MRLVIQRVDSASVEVDSEIVGKIGTGLMVLVGVETGDSEVDASWLAQKTCALRIFDDDNGVMNRSLTDIKGKILAISQFTLTASTRKGNRPSYIRAAPHLEADRLYEFYCSQLKEITGTEPQKGIFGAHMKVSLINDGPVTIIIDSRLRE